MGYPTLSDGSRTALFSDSRVLVYHEVNRVQSIAPDLNVSRKINADSTRHLWQRRRPADRHACAAGVLQPQCGCGL